MGASHEYRDREPTQVAVLDALVDRADDGMTVFELRAAVTADIDDLESALAQLKADGLIVVENAGSRTVIKPADEVLPAGSADGGGDSLLEWLRDRLPF